jgi:hypothetical protein
MTNEELKAIRERAEAATPGPWYWEKLDADGWNDTEMPCLVSASDEGVMDFGDCEQYYPTEGSPPNDEDAEFIAHAREDVPKLLAEIERLRKQFDYITELALEFYENDYVDDDGITVVKLDERFESHRGTLQEILVISSEEAIDNDED